MYASAGLIAYLLTVRLTPFQGRFSHSFPGAMSAAPQPDVYSQGAPPTQSQFETLLPYVFPPDAPLINAAPISPRFAYVKFSLPGNHPATNAPDILRSDPGSVVLLVGKHSRGWWKAHSARNEVGWVHQFTLEDYGFNQEQFDVVLQKIPRPSIAASAATPIQPVQAKVVAGSSANELPVGPEQIVWVTHISADEGWLGVVDPSSNNVGWVHRYCLN